MELFRDIDQVYSITTERLGFSCKGCDGAKCCSVDLIVHTASEQNLLEGGVRTLAPDLRDNVVARAAQMVKAKHKDPNGASYRDSVCALNFNGMCALYHHRPMICRLAGLPHKILKPDGSEITGPGCHVFHSRFQDPPIDGIIDRSQFYRRMAELETDIIKISKCRTKPRTIAEIIWEMEI